MPPVHRDLPALPLVIPRPLGTSPTDLVDPQHCHRLRLLRQHRRGACGERGRHDRPGQAMITRGLHDRAPCVGDRRTGRPPQPVGQPGPRWDLIHGFGERLPAAPGLVAMPPALTPPQINRSAGDREIPGSGRDPLLHSGGRHRTSRAGAGLLVRSDQVHDRPVVWFLVDPDDGQAGQAQQPGRIVVHARGSSVVIVLLRQQT